MKYKFGLFLIVFLTFVIIFTFNTVSKKQVPSPCPVKGIESKIVIMKEESFQPETLTIKKCTKVVFENKDKVSRWPASNLHPTHGIYPEFDPKQPVEAGKDWSFVFDKVGSWRYHDHLAPSTRGTVVVE